MQQTAPKTADSDLTMALAEEIGALTPDALSADDVIQLRRLLLDHLGVCLRGSDLPWGRALTEWARTYHGTGPCVIFGTTLQTTAPVAALVNATGAHGLEMDDTHDISLTHPGAPVIATALAVGVQEGRSGGEIMAAIAAGYEVMGRIGAATDAGNMIERGFHPTALFGGFGAAAAAGKLYGLDAVGLCRAWGLMLSMAGGSMQFAHDPEGTTVKRLHGGYGAHNGTMAAQFARLGIDGPRQAFDGVYGVAALYGPNPNTGRLRRAPGTPLEIHRISMKPYPCCRLFHSTIDALRDTTDGLELAPEKIAKIRVGGPTIMVTQHMMRRPTSVMAAQYSLPFALATSLIAGPHAYESYAEDMLDDASILALGDRVEAEFDGEMEKSFPEHLGSWVELTTTDGEIRRADVLDSHGTPARPMTEEWLREKFEGLTDAVMPDLPRDAVYAALERFDMLEDASAITRLFARA